MNKLALGAVLIIGLLAFSSTSFAWSFGNYFEPKPEPKCFSSSCLGLHNQRTTAIQAENQWRAYERRVISSVLFRMPLAEKDPVTWEVVPGGKIGSLTAIFGKIRQFRSYNLEPSTDYTLIYYGDKTHNDVWPYATCLSSDTSSSTGRMNMRVRYSRNLLNYFDPLEQKFWLVPSTDVDCEQGKMIAWNPTRYLFEWRTQ